ncbi:hypothetical protein B0O99DRAFT_606973 [Bisporella sp. PMI_857]|nr:hypothetical protein B0O99DRAFT_606973 [Bisporella sp. PMI_857]
MFYKFFCLLANNIGIVCAQLSLHRLHVPKAIVVYLCPTDDRPSLFVKWLPMTQIWLAQTVLLHLIHVREDHQIAANPFQRTDIPSINGRMGRNGTPLYLSSACHVSPSCDMGFCLQMFIVSLAAELSSSTAECLRYKNIPQGLFCNHAEAPSIVFTAN